ncbi:MAG: lysophospholipid acyltransferase family protein [Bacteroidota bacterium]|nr:lysophospholipid acyltransferase family protein [Bacteroidota bacterium]
MQNHIEYFFFRTLYQFVRLFSFRNVQRIGSNFGTFIYSVIGLRKKLVLDNLRHAFPGKSEKEITEIAIGSYRNLFTAFFEILYLDKLTADQILRSISFPDIEKFKAYLKDGKGLIILTGHYGNWELCALAVSVLVPEKYTVVVQKQRNPFINDFMASTRSRFGSKLVVMERALRESLRAISNNETVALIADQSGPEGGIYADFFGRPASTHQGPAIFQLRSSAPMIMLILIREGFEKFRIELEEIDTTNLTGTEEEKMKELTQRHVSTLERYIRLYPEQWLWMHKRWKHTETYLKRKQEGTVS